MAATARDARPAAGSTSVWTGTMSRRPSELRSGDVVEGHLVWGRGLRPAVEAQVGQERWTFRHEGFLGRTIAIRSTDPREGVARIEWGALGRGTLAMGDGRRYRWVRTRFWRREWAFVSEDGVPVASFRLRQRWFHLTAEVSLAPSRPRDPLGLLAALGWYLLLDSHRVRPFHAAVG